MSLSHPRSNSMKLSDQRWYQNSSSNMSVYMNSNAGSMVSTEIANNYSTKGKPITAVKSDKIHTYRKPSNHNVSEVERLLPELLVMEIHRDGNAVTYRHHTIRGLYRYVLDAIADRTGLLQAAAYAHTWKHKTIGGHITTSNTNPADIGPEEKPSMVDMASGSNNEEQHLQSAMGAQSDIPADVGGISHPSAAIPSSSSITQPNDIGDSANTIAIGTNNNVTYRERLGGYLHPRDMRRLVTPFSTSNEPEIIVRRHAILINYDPLRTIILRDRLLVLVPNGADSLLSKLESRVRGSSSREDMENTIFGANVDPPESNHLPSQSTVTKTSTSIAKSRVDRPVSNNKSVSNEGIENNNGESNPIDACHEDKSDDATDFDEWHEMAAREWVNLPFELQCTDAVLYVVGSILEEETIEVQQAAETFIERIVKHGGSGLEDDPLTIIRVVKDAVQLMSNRVKSYVHSINRLLDDDEDMALMNLSRLLTHPERFVQPVPQRVLNEESDEPELILESNLQVGLTLVNYLDVIQGQIHTAKELIDQRLDATRNKLLFANMLISVFTLCVTLGALVGSFFGMNLELPNNLADDDFAFNQVVAYTCLGCLVICVLIMIALLYTDTIPFRLSRRFRSARISV